MASANGGDRTAAGILRLLLGMAMGPLEAQMPEGGLVMVQHYIIGDDGDLFSGGVGGGVPPASKSAIAALKEVKADDDASSLGDCAICLDGFTAGKEMPCGHRFHGECLEKWLGVHGSCPVCRRELPPASAVEEERGEAAAGEGRTPRGALVVSYLVIGNGGRGGGGRGRVTSRREEDPWNIRIDDVD